MLHTDAHFAETVSAAVARLEQRTDAEIVVVASPRSGSYRDVAAIAATACCALLLGLILYLPWWNVTPTLVLVDLLVAWPLLFWAFGAGPLVRLLTRSTRREAQVKRAALAEFVAEAVHGTPNRTGVLVYVSALERRVEVVPDLGIVGRIAPGELAAATKDFSADQLDQFVRGLDGLGDVLARHLPHHAESDLVDLSNAPRIRT